MSRTQIKTLAIADSNVTTAKIADSSVTTAKIADSSITTAKIADSSVTTAKIADSSITTDKIIDGNVTTAKIADSSITTDKIADGVVGTTKITNDIATRTYVDNKYIIISGALYTYGYTNQVGSFNDASNFFDLFPPAGKTMSNLVAFIPSIHVIHFNGAVNQDDSLRCSYAYLSDRIRVWVQNTEQRSTPAANYFIVWS